MTQDFSDHDAQVARAEGAGREHVLALGVYQRVRPRYSRNRGDDRDRERHNHDQRDAAESWLVAFVGEERDICIESPWFSFCEIPSTFTFQASRCSFYPNSKNDSQTLRHFKTYFFYYIFNIPYMNLVYSS